MKRIYKLLKRSEWEAAAERGVYEGSEVDRADGFIHFSDADQAQETARRHFQGQDDLVLVTFDAEALGPELKWEESRGGALFPHLYAPLTTERAIAVRAAPPGADGVPDLGRLEP